MNTHNGSRDSAAGARRVRSLRRRSQQAVRKGDIRVVASDAAAVPPGLEPAQSTGSGGADDLCCQRLQAWASAVDNYEEYFRSMAAAELDLATVYARIGDILKVPQAETALLLPADADGGGVQGVGRRLKAFQQVMVENHCAISGQAKNGALAVLGELRAEVRSLHDTYTSSVRTLYEQLEQCKTSTARRMQLLAAAVTAADEAAPHKEVAKDPFIVNLEVEALLRRRADLENRLHQTAVTQQARIGAFEPQFVERLAVVVSRYMEVVSERHKRLRLAAKRDVRAIGGMDSAAEWTHFSSAFGPILGAPLGTTGQATADDAEYDGKHSEWVRVLRQGVVALKEHGPLFRSTWQSKYGVLTTRGYFHVFRSQGDVVRGAPETSIFLPRARIAMVRSGTLQVSSGGRLSRCRIVIQDAAPSLDNWRLLMESVCHRAIPELGSAVAGLETPPDSGSDESPHSARPVSELPHRRRSLLAQVSSIAATPTRKGRPFSADVSMLAQTPTPMGALAQRVSFTPTQNIYMRPLDATPASPPNFARISYLSPVINPSDVSEFAALSPSFSDVPGGSSPEPRRGGVCPDSGASQTADRAESSSSSGPSPPSESPSEHSSSQDSETAPIASLPKLYSTRQPRCVQEPFPACGEAGATRRAAGSGNNGSIVDLQRPRQYSSSTGYVPMDDAHDIWRADLLAVPDPAMRISSDPRPRPRPRSMIYSASDNGSALLDPHNPYLGEFLARRRVRGTRAGSRAGLPSGGPQPVQAPGLRQHRPGSSRGLELGSASPAL